jgi:hypothetical protein
MNISNTLSLKAILISICSYLCEEQAYYISIQSFAYIQGDDMDICRKILKVDSPLISNMLITCPDHLDSMIALTLNHSQIILASTKTNNGNAYIISLALVLSFSDKHPIVDYSGLRMTFVFYQGLFFLCCVKARSDTLFIGSYPTVMHFSFFEG